MIGPVRAAYDQLIAAHELKPDPAQARAVAALDRLPRAPRERSGLLSHLFGSAGEARPESICGAASGAASRC